MTVLRQARFPVTAAATHAGAEAAVSIPFRTRAFRLNARRGGGAEARIRESAGTVSEASRFILAFKTAATVAANS